jgi:maltooligosyltrehalose trehalohydrolase
LALRAEVWAPRAGVVELVVEGDRVGMTPVGDGWHRAATELAPGVEYAFSLDGSEPLADPRSHWQPDGVFGPSRVVDHDAFAWTDHDWRGVHLPSTAVYELHIGTFTPEGTFTAAIEALDHIVDLGVGVIEIMPVAAFDGDRGWGYDGVLLYAAHEPYGGPEGLKRLVDAAHARGVGVLLDVVYNHFGPTGNHLGRFGPYTTDAHQTPWGDAVNLDGPDSGPVRRFLLDNARHWLERYHLDGLRLDAVHALVDDSETHFLAELAEEVDALAAHVGRPLWLVAEYPTTDPVGVTARDAGGHGLDAEWRDEVHHSVHALLTGERDGYYAPYGSIATLADSLEGPKEPLPRERFVVCAQNHDQVGNRAKGERLCHLVDDRAARIAAALIILGPFVPLLFMGEEWAASTPFPYFAGPRNSELDDAVRRGRTEEFAGFGWDASAIPDPIADETFASARLRWDEIDESAHAAMLEWYRSLLAMRRAHPDLTDPRPEHTTVEFDEAARSLVMHRGAVRVAVDFDAGTVEITP